MYSWNPFSWCYGVMISVSQGVLIVQQQQSEYQVPGTVVLLFVFFLSSRLLSSSTRRRFYPQRSSGEAVVTGVVPSPRYVPSIFVAHRVQHSHCSSIFIECCYLTLSRFPLINFLCKKKSLRTQINRIYRYIMQYLVAVCFRVILECCTHEYARPSSRAADHAGAIDCLLHRGQLTMSRGYTKYL